MYWDLLHIDLKTAFLQEETYDLDRRVIHVQLPSDIGLPPYLVGLCTRSVYGLADAPRRWWNRLDKFLISLGIPPTRADRCTYVCYDGAFKNDDVSSGTKTPKQVSYYVDSPSALNKLCKQIVNDAMDLRFWPLEGQPRLMAMPDAAFRNNSDKSSQRAMVISCQSQGKRNQETLEDL